MLGIPHWFWQSNGGRQDFNLRMSFFKFFFRSCKIKYEMEDTILHNFILKLNFWLHLSLFQNQGGDSFPIYIIYISMHSMVNIIIIPDYWLLRLSSLKLTFNLMTFRDYDYFLCSEGDEKNLWAFKQRLHVPSMLCGQ